MILLATGAVGLESVATEELRGLGLAPAEPVLPGILRLRRPVGGGDLAAACRARTVDDLYLEIWAGDRDGLRRRLAAPTWVVAGEVLAAHRDVLAASGRRPRGRIKTTCFLHGAHRGHGGHGQADLRRQDVELRMARQLRAAYPAWRLEPERPDAEFVAFVSGRSAILALRLTDPGFRHRHYLRAPGALSPTVAAALVRLSRPGPRDRLLDPCCGGGTILLERAQAGPYLELLGGDQSPEAVEVARLNFGNRHRPWQLHVWDARALPLAPASVNRVISNLPFGVQISASGGVAAFAAACLREAQRVLEPQGRAVFLWPRDVVVAVPELLAPEARLSFDLAGQAVVASVWVRRSDRD